jgi:drug/metabolite transporter (DMT)-like permease
MTWFFFAITAVFFIAIETVVEKRTLAKARSFEFAAMFAFGNAIVLTPFLLVADLSQINVFILGLIFLASIPSAGSSIFIFKTIKHNQLSEAAPILALMPLVVTLFAYVLLNEKMTILQLSGIMLIVVGMIFLELKNFRLNSGIFTKGRGKYILYILLYLLIGGFSAMFDRVILFRYQINPLAYLILIQLFIAANYTIFFLCKRKLITDLKIGIKQSWKIIFFVSLLTVTHRYLYASAIQLAASMGMVVAIYRLTALFNVFAGGKFFAEDGISRKVMASMVILSGTLLLVLK